MTTCVFHYVTAPYRVVFIDYGTHLKSIYLKFKDRYSDVNDLIDIELSFQKICDRVLPSRTREEDKLYRLTMKQFCYPFSLHHSIFLTF